MVQFRRTYSIQFNIFIGLSVDFSNKKYARSERPIFCGLSMHSKLWKRSNSYFPKRFVRFARSIFAYLPHSHRHTQTPLIFDTLYLVSIRSFLNGLVYCTVFRRHSRDPFRDNAAEKKGLRIMEESNKITFLGR